MGKPSNQRKEKNPGQFIIPAQDGHGHAARMFCKVQPAIERQVDVIVQLRVFPWRTHGDFMRWAIVQGVKWVEDNTEREQVPNAFLMMAETNIELARDAMYWVKFKQSLDELEKAVNAHMQAGADTEALRLLNMAHRNAAGIEEEVWRRMYLKEMDKKFDHIWKQLEAKRVKLGEEDEDDVDT